MGNDKKHNNPSSTPPADSGNSEPKLSKEQQYLEGWQRAKADFENYKKDEMKRLQTILMSANEQLIKEQLMVLDSFDLALASMEKEGKAEKGMYLIRSQFEDTLKKFGLERVVVSVGKPFDPSLHEAVASVKSDQESETVVEEIERGYLLNGKLIRPARVKVSK
jgi:molecular chaperone GrpE